MPIIREHIFVTEFYRQYMIVFLTQNLHFLLMKLGFIIVGISMLRTTGIGAVLTQDRLLKYHFMIRRLLCGVPLLLHE
jgi:hypothetical protein